MSKGIQERRTLAEARRVVVKVGTHVLVGQGGRPLVRRFEALADQVADLHRLGREVVLVSSGAIGVGVQALGLKVRPRSLPELQMAAAVGQSRLMARWGELFERRRIAVGQVLLTHDDLKHRVRHLNARNSMMALLRHRILPVVNENDVVAVDEIRFGDNDHLAALVAMLVGAELLVLLTSADGVRAPGEGAAAATGRTRRVSWLSGVDDRVLSWAGVVAGRPGGLSLGGMASKLQAARTAAETGLAVAIADGRRPDTLGRLLAGEDVGTLIGSVRGGGRTWSGRKRWIAYFNRPEGALLVDDGAREALTARGKSLLPAGVLAVEGGFGVGAVVAVKGADGAAFARGLVEYNSEQIERIKGLPTRAIERILGSKDYDEVIHRDNLAVLECSS